MSTPIEGMVDVSDRGESPRRAVAEGFLVADADAIGAIRENRLPKADPIPTARAAALLAVKQTPQTIPHCHPIRVTAATVDFEFAINSVRVRCEVRAVDRTGPQMEAIGAVTGALLTLYDMVKALCPTASLERIALVEKEGGRSGRWRRDAARRAGVVVAVCLSQRKGTPKDPVDCVRLVEGHGVADDAHAGAAVRQVSLLCASSVEKLRDSGVELLPGVFAENVRVSGLDAADFHVGAVVRFSRGPVLLVTQIGKECHKGCAIARTVGRCIMPTEGVFACVVRGGEVRAGDALEVIADEAEGGGAGGQ